MNEFRLREHVWISALVILFLYVLAEGLSEGFIGLLSTDKDFVGILVKFAFFGLLGFLVIPVVLRLPNGDKRFRIYLEAIRLSRPVSLGRILFLSLSCYAIFVGSQIAGSFLYHTARGGRFILDFGRNSLLDPRTLTSGIFEELIFRGVLISLFSRRYSENRSICFSALLFGGIHLLNIFNPAVPSVWVLAQVVWALGLGLLYGYLLCKTDSLLPPMLLHYLLNAFVGVWFRGPDAMEASSVLYGIPFFGLVPAALAFLWVRFLYRRHLPGENL